jgi:hypothetical protein
MQPFTAAREATRGGTLCQSAPNMSCNSASDGECAVARELQNCAFV